MEISPAILALITTGSTLLGVIVTSFFNLIFIADCRQVVKLEFPIGNGQTRRHSLHKLDLLYQYLVRVSRRTG